MIKRRDPDWIISFSVDFDAAPFAEQNVLTGPRLTTLENAVKAVVAEHGGVRAAARATGVDKSFISRLMNGHKTAPSDETLRLLGLRAVPLYEVLHMGPTGVKQ